MHGGAVRLRHEPPPAKVAFKVPLDQAGDNVPVRQFPRFAPQAHCPGKRRPVDQEIGHHTSIQPLQLGNAEPTVEKIGPPFIVAQDCADRRGWNTDAHRCRGFFPSGRIITNLQHRHRSICGMDTHRGEYCATDQQHAARQYSGVHHDPGHDSTQGSHSPQLRGLC